jgi:flagellar biosynthesis anti-sigma factor FlgM
MIMKINDARTLNQPSAFQSVGQVPDAVASKAQADASAQPAAKIDLSAEAKDTRASAAAPDMDQALIDEIRQRIQNGTFKIDHQHISQSLVRDAMLATRR